MARKLVIKPIELPYDKSQKTLQTSLALHGYVRGPGAKAIITPIPNAAGRYRTGLDVDASYIKRLPEEAQKVEIELINSLITDIKDAFGPDVDLGPMSKIWNPWANHEGLKVEAVELGNDVVIIEANREKPITLLTYAWARVHPSIARSMESFERRECPECRYYIENYEAEQRVSYNRKRELNSAIVEFDKLSPTRKKDIAAIMGLPITESTTEEAVYNLVDDELKKADFNKGEYKGRSVLGVFKELLLLTPEHVAVKVLINQALRYNIYRAIPDVNGRIEEGTITIASSKDELTAKLMDDKNQKERLALEAKIRHKKEASQ